MFILYNKLKLRLETFKFNPKKVDSFPCLGVIDRNSIKFYKIWKQCKEKRSLLLLKLTYVVLGCVRIQA